MTYNRTLISYTIGFISSIILSLFAFWIVTSHLLTGWNAVWAIFALALVQCAIQLFFFLHLGSDTQPRWKLLSMVFMLVILCIVVIGSLWIMNSLNGRMMMTPEQMNQYMDSQAGL